MATYVKIFFAFALMLIPNSGKKDIDMAIDEMERANYFTFVMLINMVPPNQLFQGNVTFLMPSDKSLSRSMILENSVEDLLLRHSIPSPLLFDHLLHLPTNSILPTSNPDLMLTVSNSGTRGLFLGNVRIVTPNICTHGYSVRCHGIDGVLSVDVQKPGLPSPITCSSPLLAASRAESAYWADANRQELFEFAAVSLVGAFSSLPMICREWDLMGRQLVPAYNYFSIQQPMATYVKIFFAFALMLIPNSGKKDIDMAIDEMERANYFTFVMLINMVPPNQLFQGNVTFLMPSDKSLSRSMILENSVEDLLLRHSIPSPLLFDHLLHLPTNSILPTSNPDLMLTVSNSGTRGLFLGNVRIVTPNICTHGYSVRCHGIDGVLSVDVQKPGLPSPITCSSPLLAPPSLAPPPHYETSGGGRPQLKLSFTCITFVWVLHSKAGYGMTEAGPVLSMSVAFAKHPLATKSGSCGSVVRNAELKVIDPDTHYSLRCNQPGEICIRGPQIMKDHDDEVFIVDRVKELIKFKGFQVPPAELEALLVPVAFVVLLTGMELTEEAVKDYIGKQVVFDKKLHKVYFVTSIPKSASGKILRKDLRAKLPST
ncbi:hypothetical protein L1987_35558 [Smallanthus sonchifolius]|uniref:Uncharacterized protein n=1 Tax=Smallanthus sonchifolius TaxID=185202 RepID=A0ACB9HZK1_9ASTR|nr:hypothetical protein L1987_35558 [Smallanthus sonchifolius]